jgi:DNA-directed RNA polymerase specialized sigma24 family protein
VADFERFYAERYRHAVAYAFKLCGPEAEDIVQDVFLYVFRRLPTLPDLRPTRLFAWVKFAALARRHDAWHRHRVPADDLVEVEHALAREALGRGPSSAGRPENNGGSRPIGAARFVAR